MTQNGRIADHPVDTKFLERWSPRSFTGEPIGDADLMTLFEAARWAPSAFNAQPWRFLYAKRDTPEWPVFFDLLFDGNKRWCADASALVAIVSKRVRAANDGSSSDNYSHSFDTGAAWGYLALQASHMGWAAHAMGGFDVPRAIATLQIPDAYRIECMVAIGRYKPDEVPPNSRSPITSFVREGIFAA